ncbi:TlpA family protein disulfide reductase [Sinomonas soli]
MASGTILLIVAATLVCAGVLKIPARTSLVDAVKSSGLPRNLAGLAQFVPLAEIAVGTSMLLPPTRALGTSLASLMMSGFLAWQAAVRRQGLDVRCSCFGGAGRTIDTWTLARSGSLLLAAWIALLGQIAAPVIALAELGLCLVTGSIVTVLTKGPRSAPPPSTAMRLLDITVRSPYGTTRELRELQSDGRLTLVVFLSPNCDPCRELVKDHLYSWLLEAAGKMNIVTLVVVPNLDGDVPVADGVLLVGGDHLGDFGVRGTPSSFLVEGGTVIAGPHTGTCEIDSALRKALQSGSAAKASDL